MASAPQHRPTRLPSGDDPARLRPAAPPAGGRFDDDQGTPLLDTLLRVLRVRKWWVLQALVIVPLVVTLLTLRQEERYTATANLLFRDAATSVLDEGGSFTDPEREAATNQDLVALPVVAQRAAEALGGGVAPDTVAASITVEPTGESDVVGIEAETTDPELSARMANAYGEAYIEFRRTSDRRQLQQAIDLARARLDELTPEQRAGAAGASLEERLNRLLLAQSLQTGNAELVQRATAPSTPSSPDLRRNLILGVLLGGLLGFGLAALRDRVDQSIKRDDEFEEIYGAPVLARLPRSGSLSGKQVGDIERSAEAETLRMLRANLRYFDVDERLRSILVSSPMPGDGKSTVARGLAIMMASMGDHVVLVEADLHKPSMLVHGPNAARGLSTVLAGGPLDAALAHLPIGDGGRQLTVLPSGPVPPNPVELLESNRMVELLTVLERRFELVVIDSPALSRVSDARALVGEVSGVLIVSAVGHTTRTAAIDFRKQLALLEGHALGVVANMANVPRDGYYYGR